jgi:organic hydroperoxide reductase OsmC/OhrA/uncharacterized protein YciI
MTVFIERSHMLEDRRDFIRLTLAASQRTEAATASGDTRPLYLVVYHRGLRWIDGRPTAEQPGIKEHFLYYLDLYRRGHLRFGGGFADDSGGAAVFEATDDAAAASFVAADPAVRSEAFRYELKRWTLQPWEEILKQRGACRATSRPVPSSRDHQRVATARAVELLDVRGKNMAVFYVESTAGRQHGYPIHMKWTGNTGTGTREYRGYERAHEYSVPGKPIIPGSSDPAFRGDKTRYNPEELLVMSIASCHMLWFLYLASQAGVVVTAYEDDATGTMVETADSGGHFVEVVLRPRASLVFYRQLGELSCAVRTRRQLTVSMDQPLSQATGALT